MRACRTDDNHGAVIDGLRRAGYRVHDTSGVGGGFPDLLVGTPWGALALVEVKNATRRWEYTVDQLEWRRHWRRFPIVTATGAEDAIRQLREMQR